MLTFAKLVDKPQVFQMLTGLSLDAFRDVLPTFVRAAEHVEQQTQAQRPQSEWSNQLTDGALPLQRSACSGVAASRLRRAHGARQTDRAAHHRSALPDAGVA